MIKREMQRYYAERETTGPEFDDRLIKLVRANPAIYDVSHPHYRRNPVRVDIWDRIANELGASSRFLQTKWKNIRYNYLQEIKALETGQVNPNVRKRRFTEDLSFLQNTAQTYNVRKSQNYFAQNDKQSTNTNNNGGSSDNDSNSFLYPDPEHLRIDLTSNYDIIELDDNSEDGMAPEDSHSDNEVVPELMVMEPNPDVTLQQQQSQSTAAVNGNGSNSNSHNNTQVNSPASSPLLMPMVVMGNGDEVTNQEEAEKAELHQQYGNNSALSNGEVTIEPIYKPALTARRNLPGKNITGNAAKRKTIAAPVPRGSPINDPIELYCLSLVDTLRSMPRSERERVKFEFANILKDAKYKDEA